MQILLVEDSSLSGPRIQFILEMEGHTVTRAASEALACTILEGNPFPMVLVNTGLLRVGSSNFCRQIRSRQGRAGTCILMVVPEGEVWEASPEERALVDDVLPWAMETKALRSRIHLAEHLLHLHGEVCRLFRQASICSYCHQMSSDQGLWQQVEAYLLDPRGGSTDHYVCPECIAREFDGAGQLVPAFSQSA